MKEKFLGFVNQVKETGIAETLLKSSSAEEIKSAWQKFKAENSELFKAINDWKVEYSEKEEAEVIYENSTDIENPMEIAIVIRILNDMNASEDEIFEDYNNLNDAIRKTGGSFAEALADLIESTHICNITAEDIIKQIAENNGEYEAEDDEDEDSDEDAEEEDSES